MTHKMYAILPPHPLVLDCPLIQQNTWDVCTSTPFPSLFSDYQGEGTGWLAFTEGNSCVKEIAFSYYIFPYIRNFGVQTAFGKTQCSLSYEAIYFGSGSEEYFFAASG